MKKTKAIDCEKAEEQLNKILESSVYPKTKKEKLKWLLKDTKFRLKEEQKQENPFNKPRDVVLGCLYDEWNFTHSEKIFALQSNIRDIKRDLRKLKFSKER